MKTLEAKEDGFITMIVIIIGLLVAAVVLAYLRVKNASQ